MFEPGVNMDFLGEIDLMGLLSVILFYFLILGVGMWAARKKSNVEGVSEEVILMFLLRIADLKSGGSVTLSLCKSVSQ